MKTWKTYNLNVINNVYNIFYAWIYTLYEKISINTYLQLKHEKLKLLLYSIVGKKNLIHIFLIILFLLHFNVKTGILRYKVDFQSLQLDEPLDDVDLDDY